MVLAPCNLSECEGVVEISAESSDRSLNCTAVKLSFANIRFLDVLVQVRVIDEPLVAVVKETRKGNISGEEGAGVDHYTNPKNRKNKTYCVMSIVPCSASSRLAVLAEDVSMFAHVMRIFMRFCWKLLSAEGKPAVKRKKKLVPKLGRVKFRKKKLKLTFCC